MAKTKYGKSNRALKAETKDAEKRAAAALAAKPTGLSTAPRRQVGKRPSMQQPDVNAIIKSMKDKARSER
jgi:hypothetical protein